MTVGVLRELFRHLQSFQALYESHGIDVITGPDGTTYHLIDIEYLYSCRTSLSARQAQAIELFLYENIKEREVARMMDVSETNPIAIYASQGLARLCEMIEAGRLPRYRGEGHDVAEVG